jgi:ribulose 1,5-bisphosphate synthetase/thiazole synthase
MKSDNPTLNNKAVVIGASMGGLLAARALADFYAEVLILERDTFPATGEQRKGVPQGRHLHNLLPAGQQILEKLFPGLTGQLISQGAQTIQSQEVAWFFNRAYHCSFEKDRKGVAISRPLLEATVRQRVLELPNVRAVENCDVLGLVANEERSAITGLRSIQRQPGSAGEIVHADLVVDATGRGSRMPSWLEELGYAAPPEERVKIGMGYTTRYYRRRPDQLPGKKVVIITSELENPRLGVAMAEEAERWIVTLGGYFGDHAPVDEEGFLAFARSLASPDLYEFLKEAEPVSAPTQHKFPFSQRRHYEKLSHFCRP